jgi:hypothetical protein
MKKFLLPYVVVPAAVLILVTLARALMEIQSPTSFMTTCLSANVLSMIWMFTMPAVMLKKGLSLVHGMIAGFLFFLLHRLAIGTVYAMAWTGQWKVEGTDDVVRYVSQMKEGTSTAMVFLMNTLPPVGMGMVILFVVWSITWVIGFRKNRPFARGAASQQETAD